MEKRGKLIDPVEGKEAMNELASEMAALDISNLNPVAIPLSAAKLSRPFDGYPVKRIKLNGFDVCLTHIVLYNHVGFPIQQDRSAPKIKGKTTQTYHNRYIRDVDNGGNGNVSVHFDRPIQTAKGEFYGSVIPDPYIRCQLCFEYDVKTSRIKVDSRYLLLDADQFNALKKCYEQVINPQLKIERAADFISGSSKEAVDIPEA